MKRDKKTLPFLENVSITGLASEGKAVARVNDQVVFIPYGAPGDVVDVQIRSKRSRFMEGNIVRFQTESPMRTRPFCPHFGLCGGCRWQHLPYENQAAFKQQQVVDALERIGGYKGIHVEPILASSHEKFYRNKLEFTFTSHRWLTAAELPADGEKTDVNFNGLGFHLPGRFDRILNIDSCYLQPEPSNNIRQFVKTQAEIMHIPFHNPSNHEGILRNLIIRNNSIGDFMVILVVREFSQEAQLLLQRLSDTFPQIKSLQYIVNDKPNDDNTDRKAVCFNGEPYLSDNLAGLRFRIGPQSFFQTNTEQAEHLYTQALQFAALTGTENVFDLYTGTGTLACLTARYAAKVTGIEYHEGAITDATQNAMHNGISNVTFVAGDMARVLNPAFVREHGHPQVVITDPPRAGMHPDVVKNILAISPDRIVYVSCNPATQARDVAMMKEQYAIAAVQPVDMFPQTHHVENIILLTKSGHT